MTSTADQTVEQEPPVPEPEKSQRPSWLKRLGQFEITPRKVPLRELQQFSRQLAVFIKAGVPLVEALDLLRQETGNKLFKQILDEIVAALQAGSTLSDAAAVHTEAFPAYYLGILRAAELTGNLDTALLQLSEYIERDLDARHKIVGALIYPAVIAVMAVAVVAVLVGYVLPRFETFFKSLNAHLPWQTRVLLDISHWCRHYWYVLVAIVLLLIALTLWLTQAERGKALRDKVTLKLPVVGDLMRFAVLERFCRTLSAMVTAGVALPQAIAVAGDATSNYVYRTGIATARESMLRGEGLATPLADTGLFPAAARQMLRVGESTGSLDEQLAVTSEFFERELDYKIKKFTSLFEPIVIVLMGVVVAFVAIALVSAMYGIFHQVKING
jgi:type IV pilus assembly protein PilC